MPFFHKLLHLWHHDGFFVFQMRFVGLHVAVVGATNEPHVTRFHGFVDSMFELVQLFVSCEQTLFCGDIVAMFVQYAVDMQVEISAKEQ